MQKTQTLDKLILENFKASHHFKMNSNINYFIHNPMESIKQKKKIQQNLLREKLTAIGEEPIGDTV